MKRTLWITLAAAGLCLGGCASYYRVTDPTTGRVYYSSEIKQRSSGALVLKDARTGNMVSLQNSEVEPINKEQFESGKSAPPSSPEPR